VNEYTVCSGKEKLRRGKKKVSQNNLRPERWRIEEEVQPSGILSLSSQRGPCRT
jgi:hypothetical protein